MATLIPAVPKKCPRSERMVFHKLERELPDEWIVLHSLGLPGHETKIEGEADFVVLAPSGIFVIEVKGGTVSCRDGVWTYSGDFPTFTKRESPWSQAMTALGAVRNSLTVADSRFNSVLFGYGVMMPFTEFTTRGAEIRPEVLLDRRTFRQSSGSHFARLASYWRDDMLARRPGHPCAELTPELITTARRILRPDADTAFSLGSYLSGVDDEIIWLTNRQIRVSRRMAGNFRTIVRGAAGTGKTVIALDRAKQLAENGKRVLYLCFNRYLAAAVRKSATGDDDAPSFDVFHAHALYRSLITEAGLSRGLDEHEPDALFREIFPDLAIEAIIAMDAAPWDAIIIDEAQDLLLPSYLDVFDLLLVGGLKTGCWHFFLDPMQNIFGGDVEEQITERLLEYNPAIDELFENCRNTKQVAIQTSIISGIDVPADGAASGLESEVHYFSDRKDARQQIETVISALLDGDVKLSDIVILSSRTLENSVLAGAASLAGRPLIRPDANDMPDGGGILFCTIQSFKGLERKIVLAVDLEEIGEEAWSMLHYAGLSRARTLLHVFLSRAREKRYAAQAHSYGRRLSAAS